MAVRLIEELRRDGYTVFKPAPKPDGNPDLMIWDEFADCRILIAWIPDWTEHRFAGKHALRVDTIASKPETTETADA